MVEGIRTRVTGIRRGLGLCRDLIYLSLQLGLGLEQFPALRESCKPRGTEKLPAGIECFTKAITLNPRHSTVPYLSLANLFVDIHDDACALELLSAQFLN